MKNKQDADAPRDNTRVEQAEARTEQAEARAEQAVGRTEQAVTEQLQSSNQQLQSSNEQLSAFSHPVVSGVASGDKSFTRDQGIKVVAASFPTATRIEARSA
jgi:hypothetical protein